MASISAFAQSSKAPKQSMTLVGCLMGEADYRKAHELGKSYFNNADMSDEFVLVNASNTSGGAVSEGSTPCKEASGGTAYRLTGKKEKELKRFVGHRMEITGTFEEKRDAQIAAGEKSAKLPAEIVIASFREAPVAVAAAPAPAPAPAPAAAPAPAPSPAPESTVARNESREALPKTASNLPLIGLIGLFSLTAAFGLRLSRPRAS
jgi:hypothetical protein